MLPVWIESQSITAISELSLELVHVDRKRDGFIDCLTDYVVSGWQACLFHLVKIRADPSALRVFYDRQTMLKAYPVGGVTQERRIISALVELQTVFERHAVDHDVVVNALCVDVCRDYDLKSVSP